MMILHKKNDYINFRFWKFIVLFSMIDKVIEAVTASQLWQITEQHTILLKLQMRVRKSYFFEIILNLLVNQMHTIWKKRNYVIFLFLLNIINVFNWIVNNYLMHVLCMKIISEKLTKWVHIYIINHIITLMLLNIKIKKNIITAKILQNSLFLLILYFFYTAELLNVCNNNNKCKHFYKWYFFVNIWIFY